jgi:hypothetical protein
MAGGQAVLLPIWNTQYHVTEEVNIFVFIMDPHYSSTLKLLFLGSSIMKAVYTVLKTLQHIVASLMSYLTLEWIFNDIDRAKRLLLSLTGLIIWFQTKLERQ